MILDYLQHAATYHQLHPRLAEGLRFLAQNDCLALPAGRHTIDGDNLFALVQDYQTKPRAGTPWEAHRRYFDIQHVVQGEELIGYAPIETLTTVEPYNEARDVTLFKGDAGEFFRLPAGMFVIFAPQDAHMPGLALKQPAPARKLVIKALV